MFEWYDPEFIPLISENTGLYATIDAMRMSAMPLRLWALWSDYYVGHQYNPWRMTPSNMASLALMEMTERMTRYYPKPEFGIDHTVVDGQTVGIQQEVVMSKPFGKLIHFRKENCTKTQPKLLIVAPMSGHYATLCRGTVKDLLPFQDVYITDWADASEVPITMGRFDLEEYISYVIEFMGMIDNVHVLAVCQPTVPVLAAVSIMSELNNLRPPRSMILIGGPVDARHSPTSINDFASGRSLDWFETKLITRVPIHYPGFGRAVYPGFLQLVGFISMNLKRHVGEHMKLFNSLVEGDGETAESTKTFYNEYLAVCDMPAEFYLQTIEAVFKKFSLPSGTMEWRGRPVRPASVDKTSLLVLEGERDDISGVGQTKAAIDLCSGLSDNQKQYHLQKDVGHYGIFNGRKFREEVVPVICQFIERAQASL